MTIVQHGQQGLVVSESQESGRNRGLVTCLGQGIPYQRLFKLKNSTAEVLELRRPVAVMPVINSVM